MDMNKNLEEVINSEGEFRTKYQESQENNRILQKDSDVLSKLTDTKYLDGSWEVRYVKTTAKVVMKIISSQVTINQEGVTSTTGSVSFFYRDTRGTERIFFQTSEQSGSNNEDVLNTYDLFREGK